MILKHNLAAVIKLADAIPDSTQLTDAYAIEGKTTYKQEFVISGGVDLKDIDFKTIHSRITSGLFFAGVILNIDGVTVW